MDFSDTPVEAAYRRKAKSWLAENATSWSAEGGSMLARSVDASTIREAKAWQAMKAAAGFAGISWPKEFGGQGGTQIEEVIYRQEEAQHQVPRGVLEIGLGMCLPVVGAWGTAEQRERFMRTGLHGEEIWCQLFSEPSGGSDVAGVRTRAVRDGDAWVINGQKVWTSGAHFSDFGVLLARTDPTVAKHKGLTMFIVDMKAPGIEVRPIKQFSGRSEFNEVFFTDVRVSDGNRLGAENQGWQVVITTLMLERFMIGEGFGLIGWPEILKLAKSARIAGKPAHEDGRVRERVAQWYVDSEGLRLLHCRTLTALSKQRAPGPESSVIKVVAASQAQQAAYFAMDLRGRSGLLTSTDLGPEWLDVEATWAYGAGMRIGGGTDEILRNVIAERILGLPGEPRVDKTGRSTAQR